MEISKERVERAFRLYTSVYDISDEKIKLKIGHTYRVAAYCERIARSLSLSEEDAMLAWLLGMLHDIGRFEQLRRFGTFSDAQSIDHAHFGVELLFSPEGGKSDNNLGLTAFKEKQNLEKSLEEGLFLYEFVDLSPEEEPFQIIKTAIWSHSAFRVEEGVSGRIKMFCDILRDADKVDIFRVCQETPLEVIYNVTTEELKKAEVTDKVMKQFFEKHAVLRSVKRTPVDHLVGHAALCFELVYPESRKITEEQGYLKSILEFHSDNPKTNKQFLGLKEFMENYLAE